MTRVLMTPTASAGNRGARIGRPARMKTEDRNIAQHRAGARAELLVTSQKRSPSERGKRS